MTWTDFRGTGLVAAAAAGVALLATGAAAQVIDLDGKTVTLVHNASPGGATGLGAQIAADAWAKTMAGNPTIVVQSVAGGALTKGIDHVMDARPDGLTLGWLAWQGSTRILDPEALQIPFQDFGVIGGVGGANFFVIADSESGGGLTDRDQFPEKVETFKYGGFSPKSAASMQTAGAMDLLGLDWNFVSGFGGDGPLLAAMSRGEIDGYPATAVVYNKQLKDDLIENGEAVGLFHFGPPTEDGSSMEPDPAFNGEIPTFAEYYEQVKGEKPSGQVWDMIQFHGRVSNPVNWIVVAPPGTPEEHLKMLRDSFKEAMSSDAFKAEAEKVFGTQPNVVFSDEMNKIVDEVQHTPDEMKDLMRKYIDEMEG